MTSDDLALLRGVRSDPPPPGEHARAVARKALEGAMRLEKGATLAAPGSEPIRTRAAAPGTEPTLTSAAERTARRARRALRPALALLLVAGLLLAGGATLLRDGSTTQPALAAGPVLEHLARVAAVQPRAMLGPGQFLYTTSHSLTGADTVLPGGVYCQGIFRQYRENWIAADGEGLVREKNGPTHSHSPSEASACRAVPEQGEATSSTWAAPRCMSVDPVPLGRLPRDPSKLRARLLTGKVEGGPRGPGEAFVQVGDLLRETDAPSDLRAALYRAAAGLQGVKALGTIRDQLGRRGIGLALDSHGVRHELIFSPQTSALMAEQTILVGQVHGIAARRGAVLEWSAYSTPRVVDRLPAPSPLPLAPACVHHVARSKSVPGRPQDSVMVGVSGGTIQAAR